MRPTESHPYTDGFRVVDEINTHNYIFDTVRDAGHKDSLSVLIFIGDGAININGISRIFSSK